MARKRVLDPSIWTDDGMAELTPRQQLLYIGLISNADDEGRQKASPVAIRLCLPTIYANVLDGEIDADLTAVLKRMRQLVAYIADGRRYLVFQNYLRWQRIDRPSSSNLPAPPDPCANDRRTFDESSTIVRPELKELKEEKRSEGNAHAHANGANGHSGPPPPRKMGNLIALPAPFVNDTPEMEAWVREQKMPFAWVNNRTDSFVSHYRESGTLLTLEAWHERWKKWLLDDWAKQRDSGLTARR